MEKTKIEIRTVVAADIEKVWECWTDAKHIVNWNAASRDWHCPKAENDLRSNGKFSYTMAARDGSASFDFGGVYTAVEPQVYIAYILDDGREVSVRFEVEKGNVVITEIFEAENQNTLEMQQAGWQAILDTFKKYVEERN